MRTSYTTMQGDTWDLIAYKKLGSEKHTGRLMMANLEYRDLFLFPAGIVLKLPELPETPSASLPPWKR